LLVTIAQQPQPAGLGVPITYTVSVLNPGPLPATDLMLTNRAPPEAVLVSFNSSQGQCEAAGNEIHCSLGTIAAGAGATFTLVVTGTNYGRLTNVVEVTRPVGGTAVPFTATAVTTIMPPLLSVEDAQVWEGNTETASAKVPPEPVRQ